MAAHALEEAAGREVPDEDFAAVVGGGEHFAVRGGGQGGDVARVACEHADRGAALDVPHADCAVGRAGAGEDVGGIGVPGCDVHVGVVAYEEAVGGDVGGGPEAGGAVGRGGKEVVPEGGEADVPDGAGVGAVNYELGEGGEVPEADGGVCGRGEKVAGCSGWVGLIGCVAVGLWCGFRDVDGWRERESVDRSGVSDETARLRGVVVGRIKRRCEWFVLKRPDSDIGFCRAHCGKGIVA